MFTLPLVFTFPHAHGETPCLSLPK